MIVLIDNYDSFTFNLYQAITALGEEVVVKRNDQTTIAELTDLLGKDGRIVLSPGPCTPNEAGLTVPVAKHFAGRVPILGVCLGHQAIGAAFGGQVVPADYLMHGKTSLIYHGGKGVFADLPSPFIATRYHSLIVDRATLPPVFEITAETDDGIIMGLRHRELDVEGVQFHPESILTPLGPDLLSNFLGLRRGQHTKAAALQPLLGY